MTDLRLQAALWYGAAILACLSVTLINGGGLSYFDTAGYLEQGQASLASFGLTPDATDPEAGDGSAGAQAEDDGVVVGSRSAIYSILVRGTDLVWGLNFLPVLHMAAFLAAMVFAMHVTRRICAPDRAAAPMVAIPIIAAALGALPFYVAFLMPDIFAPILLLMIATLAVFAREMSWAERLFAVGLGVIAAVTHPSHVLIAAVLIPVSGLASLMIARARWWMAPLLVTLIVLGGLAERLAFTTVVKTVRDAEVVYQPFLTVRVIADGPGYGFLAERCPDDDISTCALYEALQRSDDPYRLTASHIMFETSDELGSYRLLPDDARKQIADDQVTFFLSVLKARPIGTATAFMKNTMEQAILHVRIWQTIPTTAMFDSLYGMTDIAPDALREVRLANKVDALAWLDIPHLLLYGLSLIVILWLCCLPRQDPPARIRLFALMLVAGIAANALICGGISQPSDRYGARVAFLLPLAATLLSMFYGITRQRSAR